MTSAKSLQPPSIHEVQRKEARSGKKKKIFMFRKAAGSSFKMEESSRMAIKKHRQYGNFAGEESACQRKFLMSAECFHLYVLSSEKEYKKNELVKIMS